MLSFVFVAALLFPSATYTLPEVVDVRPMGSHVLLVHESGTTLAPLSALVVEQGLGAMPIVGVRAQPVVYETNYTDKAGFAHRVVTDCKRLDLQSCARKHHQALDAYTKLFPKV